VGVAQSLLPIDQVLDPIVTREVAQRIAQIRLEPDSLSRLEELREKANDGQLTDAERTEYEEFVEATDLLTLLKEKARFVLEGDG
jgi:hypothetical protein